MLIYLSFQSVLPSLRTLEFFMFEVGPRYVFSVLSKIICDKKWLSQKHSWSELSRLSILSVACPTAVWAISLLEAGSIGRATVVVVVSSIAKRRRF